MTTERKRGHAAARARVVTAAVSAGATFGLMGLLAAGAGEPAPQASASAGPAPPQPEIVVLRRGADGSSTRSVLATRGAPAVAASSAAPVATSRAS